MARRLSAEIERLRAERRTGRSARMLFEVLGDLWVVTRNPYIQDDLLGNRKRFESLTHALHHRLDQIVARANGNQEALRLVDRARVAVRQFEDWFPHARSLRARVRSYFVRGGDGRFRIEQALPDRALYGREHRLVLEDHRVHEKDVCLVLTEIGGNAVGIALELGGMREERRGAERPVEDGPVIQPSNQRNEARGEPQVVVAAFDTIPFYIGVHYLRSYLQIDPLKEHDLHDNDPPE